MRQPELLKVLAGTGAVQPEMRKVDDAHVVTRRF